MVMKIERMIEAATKGPHRIELDTVLTKEGGGDGEPMQEMVANGISIARFTIYSKLADGYLYESLFNSAPALVALVKAAQRTCIKLGLRDEHELREALAALPDEWQAIEQEPK